VPGVSVVEVAQLVAGSVATQSAVPPDLNVMVPEAFTGRPVVDSVSAVPYGMVAGAADSDIDVLALVTLKLAPVAVALV
jgi:hypothetical protein